MRRGTAALASCWGSSSPGPWLALGLGQAVLVLAFCLVLSWAVFGPALGCAWFVLGHLMLSSAVLGQFGPALGLSALRCSGVLWTSLGFSKLLWVALGLD